MKANRYKLIYLILILETCTKIINMKPITQSQEEEWTVETLFALHQTFLDALSSQLWQFVGALQGCWDFHGPLPVVIVVALVIGELHKIFLGHLWTIVAYDVVGRGGRSLGYFLGH